MRETVMVLSGSVNPAQGQGLGPSGGHGFPSDGDKFSHNTSVASKHQENQACLG